MSKFVLTAELQFRSPVNLRKVENQIRSGLSNIDVDVKVRNSAQAKREVDALRRSTDRAADSAENLGRVVAVSFKRFATYSAATRVVSLFTTGLSNAVSEAISFEREMVKVSQVSGKTTKQLSGLSNEISRLATTLGVSSASLIGVTRILTQAGLTADETKIALEALAKSELAPTFDDITQTAEGAVAVFNQFKQGASALESQLGSINAVAGKFAVESGDLIAAVRRVGGVFKSSGGSLEELLALFTSIRSTTRESGESIATGLRTIFVRIQRPRTLKFLDELGVKLTDTEGKFVGPFEAVKRLNEQFSKFEQGDPRFIKVAEEIAGFRQIGKVIPLLQQFQVAQEALSVAQKGQNSLTEDAEKAQEALQVRITKLKEEFLLFVREVYNSPVFQLLANSTLEFSSALLKVASALKDIIPLIGIFASIKLAKTFGTFVGGVGRNLVSARGFSKGGQVSYYNNGGFVPRGTDRIPAMLSEGEYVVKASSARRIGYDRLDDMNRTGEVQYFMSGGAAGRVRPSSSGSSGATDITQSAKNSIFAMDSFSGKMIALGSGFTVLSTVLNSVAEPGSELADKLDALQGGIFTVVSTLAIYNQIMKVAAQKSLEFSKARKAKRVEENLPDISDRISTRVKGRATIKNSSSRINNLRLANESDAQIAQDLENKRSSNFSSALDLNNQRQPLVDRANAAARNVETKKANLRSSFSERDKVQQKLENVENTLQSGNVSGKQAQALSRQRNKLVKEYNTLSTKISQESAQLDNARAARKDAVDAVNRNNAAIRQGVKDIKQRNAEIVKESKAIRDRVKRRNSIIDRLQDRIDSSTDAIAGTAKSSRVAPRARRFDRTRNFFGGISSSISGGLSRIPGSSKVSGAFGRVSSAAKNLVGKMGGFSTILTGAGAAFVALTQITSTIAEYFRKQYLKEAEKNLEEGNYVDFRSNSARAASAGRVSSISNSVGSGALAGLAAGAAIGTVIPGVGTVIGGAVGGTIGAAAGGVYAANGGRDFGAQLEVESQIIDDAVKKSSEALAEFDRSIIDSTALVEKLNRNRLERLRAESNKSALSISEKVAKINEKSLGEKIVGYGKTLFTVTLPGFIIRTFTDVSFRNKIVEVFKSVGKGVYDVFADVSDSLIFAVAGIETERARGKRVEREKQVNEALRFKESDREEIRGLASRERGSLLSEINAINDAKGLSADTKNNNIQSLLGSFVEDAVKQRREALIKEFTGSESQGGEKITRQEARRIEETVKFLGTEMAKVAKQGESLANTLKLQNELLLENIRLENEALKVTSAVNIASAAFQNAIKGSTTGISQFERNLSTIDLAKQNAGLVKEANRALDQNVSEVIKTFSVTDSGVVNTLNSQKEYLQSVNDINDSLRLGISSIDFKKFDDPAKQQADIIDQIGDLTGNGATKYGRELEKRIQQELQNEVGVESRVDNLTVNKVIDKIIKDMQKSVDIQAKSLQTIFKLRQDQDAYLLDSLKKQIELESKLVNARLKTFDVFKEAENIIEKFGGKEARKDSEFALIRQNILNRNAGLGNIRNAGQISGGIASALAKVESDKAALASGQFDNDPKKFLELQNSIQQTTKALNNYIPTIRELIKGKEEELDIIAKKNKFEKDSLESLIKGDIQDFFKKQSSIGATAAIASGDERLTNLFGSTAIGGALDNLNAQKDAGVKSLFGTNIDKLIQQAGTIGLQKRGLDEDQARAGAQVIAGSTAREEQLKGQIRGLAGNLKDAGFAEFKNAKMDVANATIVVNRNVKVLEDAFNNQIKQFNSSSPSNNLPQSSPKPQESTAARSQAANVAKPDAKVDPTTGQAQTAVVTKQSYFSDADVKNFQIFLDSVKQLSTAVETLAASKIQVQLAPVNVNLNITGSNILDFVQQEVRKGVGEEVSRQIQKLRNSAF